MEPVVGFKSHADRECWRRKAFQSLSRGRKRPVHLAELRLEPEMHACLISNLDDAAQRLVESGPNSTNHCILGLIGEVRSVEIGEVVILDPVVERATRQMIKHGLINCT